MPIQLNYDDGFGADGSRFLVNVQPVIPVSIGNDWTMISRTGGWTYGALVNHLWSFAGDDDRTDISSTFLQPFLAKGLGQGRTFSVNFESSYDWKGQQWTVPFNVGYSKVAKIGSQLVSYQAGARYYFEAPDNGAEWGLRFTFTLLFPKK